MALRPARTRRRQLSMTSLIDVIFLLLLFFMLSSTFTKFAEIRLFGASAGGMAAPAETPPLFLRLSDETVQLNGQTVPLDQILAALDAVEPAEGQTLLIAPQDSVTSQRLVDVLVVLAARPRLNTVVLQ